ncbi:pilus assembly protein [Archangium violaceum]|nr:pilus assembly protein [Archangium violaceum]
MSSQETPIRGRQSGQASVEAALTLPLVIFLILGTLQLFLLLQARIMTEYAVFRATRAGSVSHGECKRMMDAAIGALLPTFARTDSPERLAEAYERFKDNRYDGQLSGGSKSMPFSGEVVWLLRESPTNVTASEEDTFDQGGEPRRLEVRMVFWYPLRIPFADWVLTRMFRAHFAIAELHSANPLILADKDANWENGPGKMESLIRNAYSSRTAPGKGSYVFPITASYTMRMMTPAKPENFSQQNCAPN